MKNKILLKTCIIIFLVFFTVSGALIFNFEKNNNLIAFNQNLINQSVSLKNPQKTIDLYKHNSLVRSYVEDLQAPELTIPDNIIKNSYQVNEFVTVDIRTITITDNDTSLTYEDIQCTLFQGSIMCPYNYDNGIYTYQVFETGDYSIRFQITDSAGNTSTKFLTFYVEENIADNKNDDNNENNVSDEDELINNKFAWGLNIFDLISTIIPIVIILAIIVGFVIFAIGTFAFIIIATAIVVTIVVIYKRKKK